MIPIEYAVGLGGFACMISWALGWIAAARHHDRTCGGSVRVVPLPDRRMTNTAGIAAVYDWEIHE